MIHADNSSRGVLGGSEIGSGSVVPTQQDQDQGGELDLHQDIDIYKDKDGYANTNTDGNANTSTAMEGHSRKAVQLSNRDTAIHDVFGKPTHVFYTYLHRNTWFFVLTTISFCYYTYLGVTMLRYSAELEDA